MRTETIRSSARLSARALFPLVLAAALAAGAEERAETPPAAEKAADDKESFFRAQPSKTNEFRATWIHSAYGIQGWGWDKTVRVLKENGFNAIIPNMLWAGLAHHESQIQPVSEKVKTEGDQIAECLRACRNYGIELHIWKVNYNLLRAPKNFLKQMRDTGRTQKSKSGEEVDWLCPSHPENFALERDAMLEAVRHYDVDGIHFDYIRYPNEKACYCNGCKERFEQASGVALEKFPDGVISGEHAEKFNDWRRAQITRLVKAVSEEARKVKPRVKVSAAVFGNWESCRRSIGQDWKAWVEEGYLDFVCPMNYTGDDAEFAGLVRKQAGWVNHKIPLYPGIGAHKLAGPEQLVRQIQSARESGADGFVIFQLSEKLATDFLPPLSLGVTSTPPKPG